MKGRVGKVGTLGRGWDVGAAVLVQPPAGPEIRMSRASAGRLSKSVKEKTVLLEGKEMEI